MKRETFAPVMGPLALLPSAFGESYEEHEPPEMVIEDGTAIIQIRGPLMHRKAYWWDSYEEILERVAAAIEGNPRRIILDIDSPGGMVSGLFDTSRRIRAMVEEADIELIASVDAQATSAAYAIATAASKIYVSESSQIGSIGVIQPRVSVREQNTKHGVHVELIRSGQRKADGHPDIDMTDDEREATQSDIDLLASMFFDLVVDRGWSQTIEFVQEMEARTMRGADAVRAGLASDVASLHELLTRGTSMNELEKALAMLATVAKGEGEDANKAALLLASARAETDEKSEDMDEEESEDMDEDEESEDMDDDEDAEDEDEESEGMDEDEKSEDMDDDKKSSAHSPNMTAALALAKVEKLEREKKAAKARRRMKKLLASRGDISKELNASLSKLSYVQAKAVLETIPVNPDRVDRVSGEVTPPATRGASFTGSGPMSGSRKAIRAKAGVPSMSRAIEHTPYRMAFGAEGGS